ncbi:hypothetical protein EW026_g7039, partial [Hermanssonia centrifuga]
MSTSATGTRKWCHCGVVCRVPREVSRTTYYQHRKLVRAELSEQDSQRPDSAVRLSSKRSRAESPGAAADDDEPEQSGHIVIPAIDATPDSWPSATSTQQEEHSLVNIPTDVTLHDQASESAISTPHEHPPAIVLQDEQPGGVPVLILPDEVPDVGFDSEAWRAEGVEPDAQLDDATRAGLDLGSLADIDRDEGRSTAGNRTLSDDNEDQLPRALHIDELRVSQAFIDALQGASLDDEDLHPDVLERLRNPPTDEYQLDDPTLHLSLEVFLGLD